MTIKMLRGRAGDGPMLPMPPEEQTPVTELVPATAELPMTGHSDESEFLANMRRLFAEMRTEAETGDAIDDTRTAPATPAGEVS